MGMIFTTYDSTGRKERRPVGFTGGACHEATRPYEEREVPGKVEKTPTDDACETVVQTVNQGRK